MTVSATVILLQLFVNATQFFRGLTQWGKSRIIRGLYTINRINLIKRFHARLKISQAGSV